MIEKYIKEYLAIIDHIVQNNNVLHEDDKFIFADRGQVHTMLNRYLYAEAGEKWRVWRLLGLISCEEDRFTRLLRLGEKRIPAVAFSKNHIEKMHEIEGKTGADKLR